MPELPEIHCLAKQMQAALAGKTIVNVEVLQPKSLNVPKKTFRTSLEAAKILEVSSRGKWIFVETSQGWLLVNLGMGGEILLVKRDSLPEKKRLLFDFDDGTCLTINFWWFGYTHYVSTDKLKSHTMTAKLGPNATDLTVNKLRSLLKGRRGMIKSFLLDQSKIAGIGNFYAHDILFLARLHPLRTIDSLKDAEITRLARAIKKGLKPSISKGGASYEVNLYGKPGGFKMKNILIGYKEGKPCPKCKAPIEKIKTGSTSSFICPHCQPYE